MSGVFRIRIIMSASNSRVRAGAEKLIIAAMRPCRSHDDNGINGVLSHHERLLTVSRIAPRSILIKP